MSSREVYESVLLEVASLDRPALIDRLAHFAGDLHLDFSEDFLARCDTDRMRHMLVAAIWRCRTKTATAV